MDYHNRAGSKKGGGGVASESLENRNRKERLRQLALETINLDKDPYIFKNHVGSYECKLCLTIHSTDSSYLSHTQGRKHQMNLARRQALEEKEESQKRAKLTNNKNQISAIPKRKFVKIGRPQYRVTKIRDQLTKQVGLTFQVSFPRIAPEVVPRYRIMSAFEQKQDSPPDNRYKYLLIAAEPYDTCAFKIENKPLDLDPNRFWTYYDKDSQKYYVQLFYTNSR